MTLATGTDWLRNQAKKVQDGPALPVSEQVAATVEVEAWLQRNGVQYAPPSYIPMSLIDEKRSRANQARRDAIVADSVDRFAAALKSGAKFPPIVVFPVGGKLSIVDGNNRQAAHRKAGLDEILGIVIAEDTPSELIQLLTVEANAHHGVTPDLSWRVQQAFHLCSLGFSDQAAADASAITMVQLRTARTVQEADQRAKAMRIAGFTELPTTTRGALAVLRDEPVFYQAARTAVDTGMTIDEVRDLIRQVKALPSEGAKIEYIGSIAKARGLERAARKVLGKAAHRVSSPKGSLVAGIGKILATDSAALVRQIVTTHDRDEINKRLSALDKKLVELRIAMSTLNTLDES